MRSLHIIGAAALIYLFILMPPSSLVGAPTVPQKSVRDSIVAVDGRIVCINEEMARLRHVKANCKKYGHLYGLKTSDGTIWSFMINPVGMELRKNEKNFKKQIRVWGKLYHNAKIIEVKKYKLLTDKK